MKRLVLVLLTVSIAGSLAAPTLAVAPAGVPDPLVIRFTGAPEFGPPTPECPTGVTLVEGVTVPGGVAAQALVCERGQIPLGPGQDLIIAATTVTIDGIAGSLKALVFIIQTFEPPATIRRTISGMIVSGTGAFRGAFGTVSGSGTIAIGPGGVPIVTLTFTFDFR